MRKVTVVREKVLPDGAGRERLVSLLATGLERLLAKRANGAVDVDLPAGQSVTTTCPDPGEERK